MVGILDRTIGPFGFRVLLERDKIGSCEQHTGANFTLPIVYRRDGPRLQEWEENAQCPMLNNQFW